MQGTDSRSYHYPSAYIIYLLMCRVLSIKHGGLQADLKGGGPPPPPSQQKTVSTFCGLSKLCQVMTSFVASPIQS